MSEVDPKPASSLRVRPVRRGSPPPPPPSPEAAALADARQQDRELREARRRQRHAHLLRLRSSLNVAGVLSWLLVAGFLIWWFADLEGSISMHLAAVGVMALIGTVALAWAAEISVGLRAEFGVSALSHCVSLTTEP